MPIDKSRVSRRGVLAGGGAFSGLALTGCSSNGAAIMGEGTKVETTGIDLSKAGALATADAVRAGEVSALEACDAAIARIEALDKTLNAVVVRDFERARATAKRIDQTKTNDDPRRLLGVPMTVKESNEVEGLPSTWGFESFANIDSTRDAVLVQRLKAQGAVILGKTNVPVALGDWQSENPVYGRTLNPFDKSRSPGGSSGGAAAALASGMVPLEIGSDIGGSIRIPSHMCGVFGHKPTYGIVPLRGHGFPGTDGLDVPLAVAGPMARNVADLVAALDIIAGPETPGYQLDLPPPRHTALKDFRVRVIREMPGVPVDSDTTTALKAFTSKLGDAGVDVSDSDEGYPDLVRMMEAYTRMLNTVISRGTPEARPIDTHEWMDLQDEQLAITRRWTKVFADTDIIISPIFSTPAFVYMDEPDWSKRLLPIDGKPHPYGRQLSWAGIATYAGLPSTAVPVARTGAGLPIGFQMMGAPYADRTTLFFAACLEAAGLTAPVGI
jgi:amidase